jgi:hypothetical protein
LYSVLRIVRIFQLSVGLPLKVWQFMRTELFEFFDVRVRNLMFNHLERFVAKRKTQLLISSGTFVTSWFAPTSWPE